MGKICKTSFMLAVLSLFLLAGCATDRSVLRVEVPESGIAAQSKGKAVVIGSVSDVRVFEENPKRQDIPSLGFGGAKAASSDLKKRAVGRKRGGFGKALGDILLAEDQTVETVIRSALRQAFAEKGYAVVESEAAAAGDAIVVDAEIRKFWAYMTPGFWAITLSADIGTALTFTIPSENRRVLKDVAVKSDGRYQLGTEDNWMETIDNALKKYVEEVKGIMPH